MAKRSSNPKTTSKPVASTAAKTLNDDRASGIQRTFAGSALSQVNSGRQPSLEVQRRAGLALSNPRSAELTKELAASLLSQSPSDD